MSDAKEEKKVIDNVDLRVSNDCTKHGSVVPEEVLQYMDFASSLVLNLEAHKRACKRCSWWCSKGKYVGPRLDGWLD